MKGTVITTYKKRGETPLACLERLRKEQPTLKDETLSYAGRLDPMAEGVMLVLVGDENKNREKYLALTKEYTFDVLFGFSTDTYDLFGKLTNAIDKQSNTRVSFTKVLDALDTFRGKFTQVYPPYSSKTVLGKPLFEWAREGKLKEIKIPIREVEIYESAVVGMQTITSEDLWQKIYNDLLLLRGDFRQKEIHDCWEDNLRTLYGEVFSVATISLSCSSGTYMRRLADDIGKSVGVPALASRIVRTKVGEYDLESRN